MTATSARRLHDVRRHVARKQPPSSPNLRGSAVDVVSSVGLLRGDLTVRSKSFGCCCVVDACLQNRRLPGAI